MDAEEIHREVERRRKLVEKLKLRESVWALYNGHIKHYPGWRENDPEYLYPLIADPIKVAKDQVQFGLGNEKWFFVYSERPSSTPTFDDKSDNIDGRLALSVNDRLVFEFEIRITTHFGEFDCYRSESFEDTRAFIEGPWTEELQGLLSGMVQHERVVQESRARQRRADPQLLDDLKKRFGL